MTQFPVRGVRIGHWTDAETGVTVVLAPAGTVGSAEVRGGAPATREIALLAPECTVTRVDAVVLTGGSAFGLAAAEGVMRFLRERGQGFATAGGPVPIVPTAAVFDLADSERLPAPDDGYAAAVDAERGAHDVPVGRVGAARGASVGKWRGVEHRVAGGLGIASERVDDAHVAALAVVNAIGDVIASEGSMLAGSRAPAATPAFPTPEAFGARENTTLVVVATDAALDKPQCHLLAASGHDGFARALSPAHTRFDGDISFALATGAVDANLDRLRDAAARVTAGAIRAAVAPPPHASES